MRILPVPRRLTGVLSVIIAMAISLPSTATEAAGDDPLSVYRSFVVAVGEATSLQDLVPYFPASAAERLNQVPPERAASYLEKFKQSMEDTGEIVLRDIQDTSAHLVLLKQRTEGETRLTMESEVELVRDDQGWKVSSPPENWNRVTVLPADLQPGPEARELGPGAIDGETFATTDWRPVASLEGSGNDHEVQVVFDPRGRYVALSSNRNRTLSLLELEGLKQIWTADAAHAWGSMSFGFDGQSLAIMTDAGWRPEIVPLMPNLEHDPPERGYFFSRPLLNKAVAVLNKRPDWTALAHHPRLPVLALGIGDSDDEKNGAIVFQPADEDLWLSGESREPSAWAIGAPLDIHWAPSGDRIAWISREELFSNPSATPVHVKTYPAGEETIALSHPDFAPRTVVFDSEGRRLASTGQLGQESGVVVWDAASGEVLATLPGIVHFIFAPDGEHGLAVRDPGMMIEAGVAAEILVMKPGAEEPVHVISAFPSEEGQFPRSIAGLGVSPNGRFLIAVSNKGDVRLWDAAGGS